MGLDREMGPCKLFLKPRELVQVFSQEGEGSEFI